MVGLYINVQLTSLADVFCLEGLTAGYCGLQVGSQRFSMRTILFLCNWQFLYHKYNLLQGLLSLLLYCSQGSLHGLSPAGNAPTVRTELFPAMSESHGLLPHVAGLNQALGLSQCFVDYPTFPTVLLFLSEQRSCWFMICFYFPWWGSP